MLAALDELIAQEGMYLRGGYFDLAMETRERAEPLVQQLVAMAEMSGVTDYIPQVMALVERSDQHSAFIDGKLQELGAEIRRIDQAHHTAQQVVPYARSTGQPAPSRFLATG